MAALGDDAPLASLAPAAAIGRPRAPAHVVATAAARRQLSLQAASGGAVVKAASGPAEAATPQRTRVEAAGGEAAGSSVAFLVERVVAKCASVKVARKYFAWLRADERKLRGRTLTAVDIQEAERLCLKRFIERPSPLAATASRQQPAGRFQATAPPSGRQSGSLQPGGASADCIEDADVIAQKLQRSFAGDVAGADAFLERMRSIGRSSKLGSIFSAADIDRARELSMPYLRGGSRSLSKTHRAPNCFGNVEVITKYILQRFSSMGSAARLFYMLHRTALDTNQLSMIFTASDVLEARRRCAATFEERAPLADFETLGSTRRSHSVAAAHLGNVDFLVKHVLHECDAQEGAETLFEALHRGIGRPAPSVLESRVFSTQEVTEAWLRCAVCYDEQEVLDGGPTRELCRPGSAAAASVEEGGGAPRDGDEESDIDDLSGEEAVDDGEDEAGGLSREDLLADLGVSINEAEAQADGYPAHLWEDPAAPSQTMRPGERGFNRHALEILRKAGVGTRQLGEGEAVACPPLQPHQDVVAFLLHPRSPVTRMLVDHPTGSGKTREMIRVLDNYFYDSRPKVPIFPKDAVCRNFYTELLRWPSRCSLRARQSADPRMFPPRLAAAARGRRLEALHVTSGGGAVGTLGSGSATGLGLGHPGAERGGKRNPSALETMSSVLTSNRCGSLTTRSSVDSADNDKCGDTTQQGHSAAALLQRATATLLTASLGGGLGFSAGAFVGALVGLPLALFTFGVSILLGVGVGGSIGAFVGATAGALLGGVMARNVARATWAKALRAREHLTAAALGLGDACLAVVGGRGHGLRHARNA